MSAPFRITPQAIEDLDAIWRFIAEDQPDAADRVEMEIIATCRRLAKHPLMGTKRRDITALPVRFWTLSKFSKTPVKTAPTVRMWRSLSGCRL
jgi:plasmid stabilization system protein ParE